MKRLALIVGLLCTLSHPALAQEIEVETIPAIEQPPAQKHWRIHGEMSLLLATDHPETTSVLSVPEQWRRADRDGPSSAGLGTPNVALGMGYVWSTWLVTGVRAMGGYDRATIAGTTIAGSTAEPSRSILDVGPYLSAMMPFRVVRPFISVAWRYHWERYDGREFQSLPGGSARLSPRVVSHHDWRLGIVGGAHVFVMDALSLDAAVALSSFDEISLQLGLSAWL